MLVDDKDFVFLMRCTYDRMDGTRAIVQFIACHVRSSTGRSHSVVPFQQQAAVETRRYALDRESVAYRSCSGRMNFLNMLQSVAVYACARKVEREGPTGFIIDDTHFQFRSYNRRFHSPLCRLASPVT